MVILQKYIKLESRATAKHKLHKLTFDANTKSLSEVLEKLMEGAFGDNAQQMIDNLLFAKKPPNLKTSINFAYLRNRTYEQTKAHLHEILDFGAIGKEELPLPFMTVALTWDFDDKTDPSRKPYLYSKHLVQLIKYCSKRKRKEPEQNSTPPKRRRLHIYWIVPKSALSKQKPSARETLERSKRRQQTTEIQRTRVHQRH